MAPRDNPNNPNFNRQHFNEGGDSNSENDEEEWESDLDEEEFSESEELENEENQSSASAQLREENERLKQQLLIDQKKLEEAQEKLAYIKQLVQEKEAEKAEWLRMKEARVYPAEAAGAHDGTNQFQDNKEHTQ